MSKSRQIRPFKKELPYSVKPITVPIEAWRIDKLRRDAAAAARREDKFDALKRGIESGTIGIVSVKEYQDSYDAKRLIYTTPPASKQYKSSLYYWLTNWIIEKFITLPFPSIFNF